MASAAARATNRAVIAHANRSAEGTNLALQVATTVGLEWRIFCNLSFGWRVWWLLTGRIHRRRQAVALAPAGAPAVAEDEAV
jgi:hypothetical protein